jgi:hypothetical protein
MNLANSNGCGSAADSCVTTLDVGSSLNTGVTFNGVATLSETLGFTLAFKNTNSGAPAAQAGSAPAFAPFCDAQGNCATWSINSASGEVSYEIAAVPLPAAAWFMGAGLLGMFGLGRRKAVRA